MIPREDARDAARWVACGVVVLLAHGGIALALSNWEDATGAPAEGVVIEISLPAAPEEMSDDPPAPVEMEKAEEQPEKPVEEKLEEKAEIKPEETPPEVKPEPPPIKEPDVVIPPPPEKVEQKPKPQVEKKPPAPVTAKPKAAPTRIASRASATAQGIPTQSNPAAAANWRSRVSAQIEGNKGSGSGGAGRALVSFSISRSGALVSASLAQSSGNPSLDSASVAIVRRAAPFPAPPPEITGSPVSMTVPIHFR